MATLTSEQLGEVRSALAREAGPVWTKGQIDAAIQAIEDVFESGALQSAINSAINTATTPLVLSAEVKRALVKFWLYSRFLRGN